MIHGSSIFFQTDAKWMSLGHWRGVEYYMYSRIPLTRENQLVALAPWTPNFSDATLATAPMTDPVTHMCWSEQISPLAYSSQATWQPFNLSHCIEIRNTHPLSRAGQLSQTYFTHSAPILAPRNQPPTVNKQWPPLRESRMSRHTRFNLTRAGAPLHSHWLATRRVTGRRPRCIHWKCLRFGDTLTLNNSRDTKYPWIPQTHLTDWIFISSV